MTPREYARIARIAQVPPTGGTPWDYAKAAVEASYEYIDDAMQEGIGWEDRRDDQAEIVEDTIRAAAAPLVEALRDCMEQWRLEAENEGYVVEKYDEWKRIAAALAAWEETK